MYKEEFVKAPRLTKNIKKILDTLPGFVWSASPEGAIEYFNRKGLGYTGFQLEEINGWNWMESGLLHKDEIQDVIKQWGDIVESGIHGEIQARMRRSDGEYLWFIFRVAPLYDEAGKLIAWWGIDIEIDNIKKVEDTLRKSEVYLGEAQMLSKTGSFGWNTSNDELFWSMETYHILDFDKSVKPTLQLLFDRVHPDDIHLVNEAYDKASLNNINIDFEHRLLMPDGEIKYLHVLAKPARISPDGLEFLGAVSDITAFKLAEQKIQQKEKEFRQIVEAVPCFIIVMSSDEKYLYANSMLLDYTGFKQDDVLSGDFREKIFHPDDIESSTDKRQQFLSKGIPFELEKRILGKDGEYRWFLVRYNPLSDNSNKALRWYTTATDIDYRKKQEENIQKENIVLREEIDNTLDLNIIGKSQQIQNVNHLISLVGLTNSSVLILGETGTGKELVARAIHNSSNRKSKVMIKVNCAALPANLIESELFGHEKGSFTGASERRIGKFELANHSTLFLDEIGELPIELQVKLLRVLQEKEFERVGGKDTIKTDVRIIAASNRNLQNEVKTGNFRSDLYYRLNVFPITVPPLRERKSDIPILSNHFLVKSSKNIGKKIDKISDKVMEELIAYDWPGNIRELEHLIERSVILNDVIINEIHLPQIDPKLFSNNKNSVEKTILENEKEYILSVLKRCNGKKGGADGAAVILGIPVSTLNSKMKKLGITKDQIYSL